MAQIQNGKIDETNGKKIKKTGEQKNRKRISIRNFVNGALIAVRAMSLTVNELQGSESQDYNAVSKTTKEVNESTSGIFGHDADTYRSS